MFQSASGIVTLTELQADDVRSGAFGPQRGRPVMVIPTCADFDDFDIHRTGPMRFVPGDVEAALRGRLVLGFVGSLNRSYLSDAAMRVARLVIDRSPAAFVLALSSQREEYSALFERHGIPSHRFAIHAVDHRAMPEWLSLIGWGLLLLDSPRAKRGSMPTKLAEFFAAGVRPLQHGCNREVSDWVTRAGSGYVLPDVTEPELERAANAVCASPQRDVEVLQAARSRVEPHFALAAGIARYARLLEDIGVDAVV